MPVAIPIGAKADESSFKSVADQVEKIFEELGGKIGKDLSGSLVDGFNDGEKSARSAATKIVNSYDKVADATGKVKTIQEQYNAALGSGNTVRIVRETERLEAARRKESQAIRQTVSDLKDYEDQARKSASAASSAFGSGFSSGFGRSRVGGYFADLKSEAESSGSAAGVLAGRAMGAGITAGLTLVAGGVAAAIGGIGYTLSKGFTRLQNIDQAEFKLKALGHTGSEVKQIMTDAEASVKGTAFGLDAAVGAAASAVAAGVDPGTDLVTYLTTIGDTAAIANTSFDEMASIFNKVQANGRAFTNELQQLGDRGVPIFTWLQQATGLAGDDFTKFVQKGGVDARLFRTVIAENIGGAAKEMGQSFSGAMDNLGAAIGRLGAAALAAPFDSAADVIGALTGKLDEMTAWMKSHQAEVIDFWSTIGQAAMTAAQVIEGVAVFITKTLAGLVNAVGDTLGVIARGVGIFTGNDKLGESFFGWSDGLNRFADSLGESIGKTGEFKNSIKDWGDNAKAALSLTKALGDTAANVTGNDVTIGGAGITGIASPGGVRDQLKMIGIGLQELPDGKLKLVAETEDATRTIDAWRQKQGDQGVKLPVAAGGGAASGIAGAGGSGKGGEDKEPPPFFDPSLWSLAANPVAGTSTGPTDNSSILNARNRIEESRLRLLELEAKGTATQSAMVAAKNNVLEAERALRDAEMRAAESQRKSLEKHTGALEQIGAQIDQDFGISKGLPGIAENLTKFVANLALAPALGALQAIAGPVGGSGAGIATGGLPMMLGLGGGGMGGANVAAMMALAQSASGRTAYGPASDLVNGLADCSGSISDLVEMLQTGTTSPGRLFTTTDFATDAGAARLGFRPGYMPGALNIGVNPLPGQSGHMAATLPNGVNFEGGGGTGGGAQYGGSAAGALDAQFPKQFYMPVGPAAMPYGAVGGGYGYMPPVASVIGGDGAYLPGLVPGAGQGLATAAIGAGPGGVPMPAPVGIAAPTGGPSGTAPAGIAPSAGAGGEGFQGVGGMPLDAMMTAASALDVLAPGAGMAAQKGIQLVNRAIGFGGQLAGIGVSGLMSTFLPHESPLADMGNSWFGRIASGFAGARPAGKNMAGQSTLPNEQDARKKPGQGEPAQGGNTINNEITLNNNGATEDAQGRDLVYHQNQQHAMIGRR